MVIFLMVSTSNENYVNVKKNGAPANNVSMSSQISQNLSESVQPAKWKAEI